MDEVCGARLWDSDTAHLIVQLAGKRWRLDIGARQEVSLQLSAVDLPGGAQV